MKTPLIYPLAFLTITSTALIGCGGSDAEAPTDTTPPWQHNAN